MSELDEMARHLFDLQEDFQFFRENISNRIALLEQNADVETRKKLREITMLQEIEDYRRGR